MPATETADRYVTSLSLPRHMAEYLAAQAGDRAMSQAAYVRLLIFKDMKDQAKAAQH